jgi:hypothetical protein
MLQPVSDHHVSPVQANSRSLLLHTPCMQVVQLGGKFAAQLQMTLCNIFFFDFVQVSIHVAG